MNQRIIIYILIALAIIFSAVVNITAFTGRGKIIQASAGMTASAEAAMAISRKLDDLETKARQTIAFYEPGRESVEAPTLDYLSVFDEISTSLRSALSFTKDPAAREKLTGLESDIDSLRQLIIEIPPAFTPAEPGEALVLADYSVIKGRILDDIHFSQKSIERRINAYLKFAADQRETEIKSFQAAARSRIIINCFSGIFILALIPFLSFKIKGK